MNKSVIVGAEVVILAGSVYGGYRIISQGVGTAGQSDNRNNRSSISDSKVRSGGEEQADVSGRVVSVGDGYVEVEVMTAPAGPREDGGGAKQQVPSSERPAEKNAPKGDAPKSGGGTIVKISLTDSTDVLLSSGNAGSEEISVSSAADLAEGVMVSVWLTDDGSDTLKTAKRLVVRTGGPDVGNR